MPGRTGGCVRDPHRAGCADGARGRGAHVLSFPRNEPSPEGPTELQIEVTGSCNLSCQMCLVAYRPRLGRSASMSVATVRDILDDLPSVRRLTLQGLGEPLLAPDLAAIIDEAVRRGIEVGFNTNGTLLTAARSAWLVAAGVSWIHVSVDGAVADTFAAIRVGGHLDTVVRNLRGLVDARRTIGATRPWIQLNTVLMRANRTELEGIVRLAADVGVDRLWVQSLSHDFSDVEADRDFGAIRRWTERQRLEPGDVADATASAALLAAELGVDLRLPGTGTGGDSTSETSSRRSGEPGCDWPWRSAYVNHDGTVQACCMLMGRSRGVMGHLHEGPVSVMWRGTRYTALRAALLTDDPPPMCRGCSQYEHRF
jgi:MoaA/NifB/PqqE/SkfB family radical SAM enzyme